MQMFFEGYEAAWGKDKAKIIAAKLDVSILDSSEDEDKDEAEDDLPQK